MGTFDNKMVNTMLADVDQLAQYFGVSRQTVHVWLKEGMPLKKRGAPGRAHQFETSEVIRWYKDKAVKAATADGDSDLMNIEEAKRRKIAAEAGIVEINLAKARGEVVPLEEVERELANKFAQFRSRIRKVPERCVLRVIGEKNQSKIKSEILDEIDQCLEELSLEDLLPDDDAVVENGS